MGDGWLTADQEQTWRRYRSMRALLDLQIARDLRNDSDLSEADYDVLSTISESSDGTWRSRELAQRLLWSTSRLSHQLRRMETRGLVVRRGLDKDGRGAVVSLSPLGDEVLRAAAPHHVASVRRYLVDLLSESDLRVLDRIARKVIDQVRANGPLA